MLATLRQFRLLALIALFASPGVGGAAVQSLHQCPVGSGAGVLAPAVAHHGGMVDHRSAPAAPDGHQQCHCIGVCCPAAVVGLPAAPVSSVITLASAPVSPLPAPDRAPAFAPSRFLPPATAPPVPVSAPLA
jgi:hypothetical protein